MRRPIPTPATAPALAWTKSRRTLIQATIATEDSRFEENLGFDPIGLTRAILQAVREGESPAGTSTITQQLVRAVLLDEEERTQRTLRRKVREIILAAELTRTYPKDTILETCISTKFTTAIWPMALKPLPRPILTSRPKS
ncbi:MAG: transglycosylase domain-containing protein [Chloroflexi bacterium]|nr:transglycosylase domain-containing protein [Chloroflexota bacterium]